jgi:hypothetical protein
MLAAEEVTLMKIDITVKKFDIRVFYQKVFYSYLSIDTRFCTQTLG